MATNIILCLILITSIMGAMRASEVILEAPDGTLRGGLRPALLTTGAWVLALAISCGAVAISAL